MPAIHIPLIGVREGKNRPRNCQLFHAFANISIYGINFRLFSDQRTAQFNVKVGGIYPPESRLRHQRQRAVRRLLHVMRRKRAAHWKNKESAIQKLGNGNFSGITRMRLVVWSASSGAAHEGACE